MKIAVAGTGYVGLSLAILLAQNNEVIALDIVEEKVKMINARKSPIIDKEIIEYLKNAELNLTATTEAKEAYKNADFIIISTPTNYDSKKIILTRPLWKKLLQWQKNKPRGSFCDQIYDTSRLYRDD